MRPAFSLIVFTSLSGLGLGLVMIMGIRLLPVSSTFWWLIQQALAMALICAGLAASTFHLGHAERAWRALSQWRTSWLSREGVLATLTLILLFLWAVDGYVHQAARPWLGLVTALSALATVWATAMIYASLKTVSRWHHPLTPVMFVLYALSSGLVLAAAMHLAGVMMSRWLFFAETKHTVSLYYGERH